MGWIHTAHFSGSSYLNGWEWAQAGYPRNDPHFLYWDFEEPLGASQRIRIPSNRPAPAHKSSVPVQSSCTSSSGRYRWARPCYVLTVEPKPCRECIIQTTALGSANGLCSAWAHGRSYKQNLLGNMILTGKLCYFSWPFSIIYHKDVPIRKMALAVVSVGPSKWWGMKWVTV